MRILVICLLLAHAIFAQKVRAQYATQWGSERSIQQISEHVFRWGGGSRVSMNGLFVPTPEGIVLIDGPLQPCEAGDSNWITEELALPDFRDLNVDNTIEALGMLGRLENVDIIVPGHMSPLVNQDYFLEYRDYLDLHSEPNDGPTMPIRAPR